MTTRLGKMLRQHLEDDDSVPHQIQKAARGSLTGFVLNAPHEYGQPRPEIASVDAQGLINNQRMREVVLKTQTAGACINAILDYVSGVKIDIRNIDPAKKANPAQVQIVKRLMMVPNPNDTWIQFLYMIGRDILTLGYAGVEIERDEFSGMVKNLWVMDAARLYVDFDEHGTILGYDEVDAHGMPIRGPDGVHGWEPEQVIFFRLNPQSNSIYPISRIQTLFTAAIIEDMMMHFIGTRFTDSNVPFGVYDLGKITDDELLEAIDQWNNQLNAQHKIILTGSGDNKSNWTHFGYNLQELEAKDLMDEIRGRIMAVLGVTMNELGESQDINKSNGYNLSFTFKKRAIEPLLNEICSTFAKRLLWETLGFKDNEFYYEEIDSRDELLQAQIDEIYQKMGVYSINHVRNRRGMPSVPGGDDCLFDIGSAVIPVDMIRDFAKVQLQALQASVQAELMQAAMGGAGGGTGPVSPPIIRPMQAPMRFTTPDGSGSSTPKIRLPKPGMQSRRESVNRVLGQGQKARGPVQQLRNQGLRKEDT